MKLSIMLLFLFLAPLQWNQIKTDLNTMNLKGNVKSMIIRSYPDADPQGLKHGDVKSTITYKFDEKGDISAEDYTERNATSHSLVTKSYETDDAYSITVSNENRKPGSKTLTKFNASENTTETKMYDGANSLSRIVIRTYDKHGKVTEMDMYNQNMKILAKEYYKYNSNGDIIETRQHLADRSEGDLIYTVKYLAYDKEGNWTKSVKYYANYPTETEECEIEYYK